MKTTTTHKLRATRRVVVAAGFALLVAVQVLSASPASADVGVIGGCAYNCGGPTASSAPGTAYANVDCVAGRVTVTPVASAQSGFVNGQYVTYRYNLQDRQTGRNYTSGWAAAAVLPYMTYSGGRSTTTPYTTLAPGAMSAASGASWIVSTQVAWHNGWAWTFTPWFGPADGGYSAGGTVRHYSSCLT